MKSPFVPAQKQGKSLKVYVFGEPGSGKTWFGLSFPKVALIDCEGGSAFYSDMPNIEPFLVLNEKGWNEVLAAIDYVEQDGGKTIQTLVIDPLTVLYQVLQEAAMLSVERKVARNGSGEVNLTFKEWGQIKRQWNRLMTRITNLPCHVVIIARQKDLNEMRNGSPVKVGVGGDVEKSTPYAADIVIRMVKDKGKHVGIIEKDRTNTFAVETVVPNISFRDFAKAVNGAGGGIVVRQQAEDEAAESAVNLFDEPITSIQARQVTNFPVPVPTSQQQPKQQQVAKLTEEDYINRIFEASGGKTIEEVASEIGVTDLLGAVKTRWPETATLAAARAKAVLMVEEHYGVITSGTLSQYA